MAAKKGGAVALQQDVTTDEEWEGLLKRSGLLLVDVYSEWCGPCVGMVGNLKKIKVELGGDMLILATARADGIGALERHRKHSEPIWMLISGGRLINLIFGADAPRIARLIALELENEVKKQKGQDERAYMLWDELSPEEEARLRAAEEKRLKALAEEEERLAAQLNQMRADNYAKLAGKLLRYTVVLFLPHTLTDGRASEVLGSLRESWGAVKLEERREQTLHVTADMANEIFFERRLPQHDDLVKALEAGPCLAILLSKEPVAMEVEVPAAVISPEPDPGGTAEEGVVPGEAAQESAAEHSPDVAKEEVEAADDAAPSGDEPVGKTFTTVFMEAELGEIEALIAKSLYGFYPSADGAIGPMDDEPLEWPPVDTPAAACVRKGPASGAPALPGVWTPLSPSTKAAAMQTLFPDETRDLTRPPPPPSLLPPSVVLVFSAARAKEVVSAAGQFEGVVNGSAFFDEHRVLVAGSEAEYEAACASREQREGDTLVLAVAAEASAALEALSGMQPLSCSASEEDARRDCDLFFPGPLPDAAAESGQPGTDQECAGTARLPSISS